MDKKQLAYAAKNLTKDETFNQSADILLGALVQSLLAAKTPEDRERKFQEYEALKRVRDFLGKLALEAKE